ncbi:MAG: hypothetical protein HYY04_16760 [Chloroflexi bacterium]|nr:hypothetical protein [Chloroflexota bacterium]
MDQTDKQAEEQTTGKATGQIPTEIEDLIARLTASGDVARATYELAAIANRISAVVNKLAHTRAEEQKGMPDWARWAKLSNAARDAVLRTATVRAAAGELIGRTKGAG